MKPVVWLGDSLRLLREFPADAMHDLGYQLEGGAFRLLYITKLPEAVYVLHVFQKKTRKTGRLDLEIGRRRLRALFAERQQA